MQGTSYKAQEKETMKHGIIKIIFTSALVVVISGCATTQTGRTAGVFDRPSGFNMCTLAGGIVGGGGAAAITLAAGPIGAAAFVGALLGTLACTEPDREPVAAAPAPAPAPPAERVAAAPEPPPPPREEILMTLTGVNFKFDSSAIEPESERILNRAVEELKRAGSVDVRIVGHTDSIGSDEYNMALSHRRANAVKDYLVRHGISSARLTTEGRGERQPVASNATAEGRYQNRRIEFHTTGFRTTSTPTYGPSATDDWRRMEHEVIYPNR
jgi:OmpA-OmpF porin, OOP family